LTKGVKRHPSQPVAYSIPINNSAFPPAAAVFTVTTCSVANLGR
jgi:hypothetical protein